MNIQKSISISGVNLDIYQGPFGISASGGADSSILLYFLMRESKEKIYIFTTGNNQKGRLNVECSVRVIEQLIKITGNSNIEHHISYAEKQDRPAVFSEKMNFYFDNNLINLVYTGVTRFPPEEIIKEWTDPGSSNLQMRTGELKPFLHKNWQDLTGTLYTPWINVDKSKIYEIYQQEGLLDTLFPLTRSCEFIPENTDKSKDLGDGHCGECFWCKERQWAFGRLS